MAKSRKSNSLDQINAILNKYQLGVNEALKQAVKETAKDGVDALKTLKYAELPRYVVRSGDYNKSWTSAREYSGKYRNKEVIHNKEHYRLTHLLEDGHMKRNGTGRTRAFPHIQPTRSVLEKEIVKITEELLNKI